MPESSETWDLVVKASWLKDTLEDYKVIASKMKRELSPSDMSAINRIVIIENRKPIHFVGASPSHLGEIHNFFFGGTAIRAAYIFESEAARPASLPKHRKKRKLSRSLAEGKDGPASSIEEIAARSVRVCEPQHVRAHPLTTGVRRAC
jgi:hypothetical protein